MICVNFILKNCTSALSLSFKNFKNADEARKKGFYALGTSEQIEITDDYEQHVKIDMGTVASVTMGDIEKDLDRQGEISLIQAKAQLRSQVNAKNDKGLAMLSGAANPSHSPLVNGN